MLWRRRRETGATSVTSGSGMRLYIFNSRIDSSVCVLWLIHVLNLSTSVTKIEQTDLSPI